jgi:molecular chaperone GrpE
MDDITFENTEGAEGEISLKDKLKKLREELATSQAQRQEYLDGWQRAKADFVNARKQEEAARKEIVEYANASLIRDLLDVTDTFEMAFAHKESWEKVDKNWRIGVESIYGKLGGVLEGHGLKKLSPKAGEKFDPKIHQSVSAVPTENQSDDDTVVAVIQSGYELAGKVLRPAKVTVAHYEPVEK